MTDAQPKPRKVTDYGFRDEYLNKAFTAMAAKVVRFEVALNDIIEVSDLHAAETNGTDICDCQLPACVGTIAHKALTDVLTGEAT